MIKSLFWVAVGAAGALQAERWLGSLRIRLSPQAVTGKFLDGLNNKLEEKRAGGVSDTQL